MQDPSQPPSPWSPALLQPGSSVHWQIGPLGLWISHSPVEWQISSLSVGGPLDGELSSSTPGEAPPEEASVLRVGAANMEPRLRLVPLVADRPIVFRPQHPFIVPGSSECSFYVTSPLWIRVEVGAQGQRVCDLPSYRLSDTWFGPSPREGENSIAFAVSPAHHSDDRRTAAPDR